MALKATLVGLIVVNIVALALGVANLTGLLEP